MKIVFKTLFAFCLLIGMMFVFDSCKHDPIWPDDNIPTDTIPEDTIPNDTIVTPPDTIQTGTPCEAGIIYFEKDVLPILLSNCATSGCHDAITQAEGIILDTYDNVVETSEVTAYNLVGNTLYRTITENDNAKLMPPPPEPPLSNHQIVIIAQWILQGAKNLVCDDNPPPCDTENVSFSATVQPIIQNYCITCHGGDFPLGDLLLTNYTQISTTALSGSLLSALKGENGYIQMPYLQPPLNPCFIERIEAWINNGAPNN